MLAMLAVLVTTNNIGSTLTAKRSKLLLNVKTCEDGIGAQLLQHILRFVGSGENVYAGNINRVWRKAYKTLELKKCGITTIRNAMTSVSRLLHARNHGLDMSDSYVVLNAVKYGSPEVLKCLYPMLVPAIDYNKYLHIVSSCAALHGRLDILKWIYNNTVFTFNKYTSSSAARGGHIHVFKWFLDNTLPYNEEAVALNTLKSGNLLMMKWLKDRNIGNWNRTDIESLIRKAMYMNAECIIAWLKSLV